ncbi:MAG: aldo/keto reductase [Pseudomonadota bacterium]
MSTDSPSERQRPINRYIPKASALAYGCMELGGPNHEPITADVVRQANQCIDAALESGINFFDHADVYRMGQAEEAFGQALAQRPALRDDIVLQSKCSIKFDDELAPGRYDASYDWIIRSVEGSLKRLKTDFLDVLILHRPDPLMEPEEVVKAFDILYQQGKVKYFGMSNVHGHQMAFLQHYLPHPLVANQIEMGLGSLDWLNEGVTVGHPEYQEANFTAGTLEYCRMNHVQIQSWRSLAQGLYSGRDVSGESESVQKTARLVSLLAEKYQCTREAIVLGFILRHPAKIQPVIGTTNLQRIKACADAVNVTLSREDWYGLYVSARGVRLP